MLYASVSIIFIFLLLISLYLDAKINFLSPCRCLFCYKCCEKISKFNVGYCPVCKSSIDIKKFLNLLDGKNNAKIKFLFEDSELLLEKFRQAQKFQENNQNKYIYFLIYKMQNMMKENNNLKESYNTFYIIINNNI